jgi:tetratricopeptide (TPR) repeat protein
MRLKTYTQFIVLVCSVSGCATAHRNESAVYRSTLYDVKGNAPKSYSLSSEDDSSELVQNQSKADYHFTLAESLSMQGEWAKAIENYKLTLIYDPKSFRSHFRLASEYVRAGLVSQALQHCEEALKLSPNFAEAHILMASLNSVLGFHAKARKGYAQLLSIDPTNQEAAILYGATYMDEGKPELAIDYFQKLVKKTQKPYIVWYYLGKTYMQSKKANALANAESAFRTAVSMQPNFMQAVIELGAIYEKKNKLEPAIALYESYQKNHGPEVSVAENLVQLYLAKEDYDKAYDQLKVINELDQGNVNAQLKMAFILVDQKKYQEAIPVLEGILHNTPDSDRVRFYLGAVYEEVKNYKAAILQFKEIPRGSKYFADGVMHTAYLYKLTNDLGSAVAVIEKNISFLDDNPKVFALYASFLENQKKYDESRKVLENATLKFPEDTQIIYQLGAVYEELGLSDKTLEKMERLVAVDENHVEGLNYLAYLYADRSKNLPKAEKLARKALSLRPNDGFILDTLGWVLYKQNKLNEAVHALEKAHQIEEKESVIAEHLGDVYFKFELPVKAQEMYRKAAENEKNADNARKIKAKIDTIEVRLQTERSLQKQRVPASN